MLSGQKNRQDFLGKVSPPELKRKLYKEKYLALSPIYNVAIFDFISDYLFLNGSYSFLVS